MLPQVPVEVSDNSWWEVWYVTPFPHCIFVTSCAGTPMIQLRGHLRPLLLLNFATYLAAHPALPRADGTVPQRMPFLHCIIVTFCTGSSPPCMLYRCRCSRACFSLAGCAPMGSCVGGDYPPAGEGQKALLLSPAAWHHLSLTSLSLTSSRNSLGRSKPKTPIKFGSRPPILAFLLPITHTPAAH